jgi:epoxyqueuosine reductase QueG
MISAEQIRTIVFKEGFAACGFSDPILKPANIMQFKKWINAGYHADMQWMERNIDRRLDLRKKFSWAKFILMFLCRTPGFPDMLLAAIITK